jgi:hypothetical protein
MSDSEGHGEESAGREMAGKARKRANDLRTQAELAWARVQRSVPRNAPPQLSLDGVMEISGRVPNEGYVAGVAASLVTSAWLYATGHRTASLYVGVIPPLGFGLGLYARYLQHSSRRF